MALWKSFSALGGVAVLLAGCNSTTCPTQNTVFGTPACAVVQPIPEGDNIKENSASIATDISAVSYSTNGTPNDFSDDKLTVTGADFDGNNTYSRLPALDRGGLLAFQADFNSQAQTYYATSGTTASKDLGVYVVTTPGNFQEGDYIASVIRSSDGDQAPKTGNATYTGGYAGQIVNLGGGGMIWTQGVATVFVEFGENGRTSGFITNRSVLARDGGLSDPTIEIAPNIVLNEGTLNENNIYEGGTATSFDAAGDPIGEGTHVGVIGGPGGKELAGYVAVEQTSGDITMREFGVFTTACVPGTNLYCPQ